MTNSLHLIRALAPDRVAYFARALEAQRAAVDHAQTTRTRELAEVSLVELMSHALREIDETFGGATHEDLRALGFTATEIAVAGRDALRRAAEAATRIAA